MIEVMNSDNLQGCRVLVVDDELLVAMMVEDTLADEGCEVVGPYARLSEAMVAARQECLDGAVLDVNLGGEKIYPLAELLQARGIPFLLVTGYGRDAVPPEHPEWRVCTKPFPPRQLVEMVSQHVCGARYRATQAARKAAATARSA